MTTVDVICYKYKPLKNGELPIKIRICKDRKTRYINLGVSTQAEDWDFEKNRPKPSCPNKEVLEKLIYNKISEIKRKIVELKSDNKDFSVATLVENVSNPTKFITVGELFKQHIHCLEEGKRTGYRLSIQQTYNSLLKFNRHLDIPFSEMDCNWLRRYETWLRKQGKSENTIGIRFRNIRVIFNLAVNMELVKQENYPFRKFEISKLHQETAKRALTKEEIQTTINYPTEGKDFYTRLAINLFTFSYFMGGINFVDMAYLTEKNIMENRLIYHRRKTGKLINLPMQERALLVLKEYKDGNKPYLFPILSTLHKTEQQFAQFLGKSRLYQYLPSEQKKKLPPMLMTDTQIGLVARAYYQDDNFSLPDNGKEISMWNVYNLLTGANKSSYIDNFLDRAYHATRLSEGLNQALHGEGEYTWFIQ